jgi:acyl carrier protein
VEKSGSTSSSPSAGITARELLAQAGPAVMPLLEQLDDDAPLLEAGVDSAHLVELGLLLEERFGAPLEAAELDRLSTLGSIDELLRDRAGSA